jgi:SAM-dependent methyltransferase
VDDDFDRLVHEAMQAPADTWDFAWLDGRAVEERPSWRFFDRVCERVPGTRRLLDLDAGTGNLLADLPQLAPLTVAADGYGPSIRIAAPRLHARGADVVQTQTGDHQPLPFADASFDLVVSRHPVDTWWTEIARVLEPGGRYFSQQVGPGTLLDLSAFLTGQSPTGSRRDPERAKQAAEDAGLVVEDLQVERTRVAFFDIGAVVYLLRVVVWTVPDFTLDRYRPRLRALHDLIQRDDSFETTSSRFLIEARRPVA